MVMLTRESFSGCRQLKSFLRGFGGRGSLRSLALGKQTMVFIITSWSGAGVLRSDIPRVVYGHQQGLVGGSCCGGGVDISNYHTIGNNCLS